MPQRSAIIIGVNFIKKERHVFELFKKPKYGLIALSTYLLYNSLVLQVNHKFPVR